MNDRPPDKERPEYRVYRARPGLLSKLRVEPGLEKLRRPKRPRRPGELPEEPERKRITPGRVVKWVLLAVLGWVLLSVLVFMVSATLEQSATDSTERALSPGGSLLTGSTILVLGSDERSKETAEPGSGGPSRADSILLLRVGFGKVRRLSILRDSFADIPGAGSQKINAAYAIGGAGLTVETVENFIGNGLKVNHIIEVSFEDFPELIDALGGIEVKVERRICAPPFGNFPRGLRFRKGTNELDGRKALGFARIRKNPCAPSEDDRDRAARQQEVLSGIRRKMLSPTTFVRLPWVSWTAPKTLRTDMAGPSLFLLFTDLLTGGAGDTRVLKPSADGPGTSLIISPEEKRRGVRHLVGD